MSSKAAPAVVTLSEAPTAGSRLSTFRIEAMDCPTEQTLIQNKLGKLAGVQQLEFNLINRILGVTHDLPSTAPIIDAIKSIGMQADPIEEGAPAVAGVVVLFDRRQFGAVVVAMVMVMVMIVIVIVLVIMLFGGVDGVAHSVASVKVPVAK